MYSKKFSSIEKSLCPRKQVIRILDGRWAHVNRKVIELAINNYVIIFCSVLQHASYSHCTVFSSSCWKHSTVTPVKRGCWGTPPVNSRSKTSARVLRRRYRSRPAVWIEGFACATVCDNLWKWPIAEKSASEDVLSELGDFMCYSAVKIKVQCL
jgi:hypothetical protein